MRFLKKVLVFLFLVMLVRMWKLDLGLLKLWFWMWVLMILRGVEMIRDVEVLVMEVMKFWNYDVLL